MGGKEAEGRGLRSSAVAKKLGVKGFCSAVWRGGGGEETAAVGCRAERWVWGEDGGVRGDCESACMGVRMGRWGDTGGDTARVNRREYFALSSSQVEGRVGVSRGASGTWTGVVVTGVCAPRVPAWMYIKREFGFRIRVRNSSLARAPQLRRSLVPDPGQQLHSLKGGGVGGGGGGAEDC